MSEDKINGVEEPKEAEQAPEAPKAAEQSSEEAKPEERINEIAMREIERLQKELKAKDASLEEKEKTLREYISSHRKAVQEFDAVKERLKRDLDVQVSRAKQKFLTAFLEVLDNLDRSISTPEPENSRGKALLDGVKMVREQFMSKLKESGVTRIESVGQSFDPEVHEAISTLPAIEADQDGKIAHEARAGYMMGDKLLRAAQVLVFKG